MKKKIIALCAGARKTGNSAQALKTFIEGLESAGDFDIEVEYPFYMDYKGCRGCLACAGETAEKRCVQKDGASGLLDRMRQADGIVFASPVYFWEPVPRFRALWERFMFPGALSKHIEIAAIYTMYQPERVVRRAFTPHAEAIKTETVGFLGDVNFAQLVICNTEANLDIRPRHWEEDLERARIFGQNFALEVLRDHPAKGVSEVPKDLF